MRRTRRRASGSFRTLRRLDIFLQPAGGPVFYSELLVDWTTVPTTPASPAIDDLQESAPDILSLLPVYAYRLRRCDNPAREWTSSKWDRRAARVAHDEYSHRVSQNVVPKVERWTDEVRLHWSNSGKCLNEAAALVEGLAGYGWVDGVPVWPDNEDGQRENHEVSQASRHEEQDLSSGPGDFIYYHVPNRVAPGLVHHSRNSQDAIASSRSSAVPTFDLEAPCEDYDDRMPFLETVLDQGHATHPAEDLESAPGILSGPASIELVLCRADTAERNANVSTDDEVGEDTYYADALESFIGRSDSVSLPSPSLDLVRSPDSPAEPPKHDDDRESRVDLQERVEADAEETRTDSMEIYELAVVNLEPISGLHSILEESEETDGESCLDGFGSAAVVEYPLVLNVTPSRVAISDVEAHNAEETCSTRDCVDEDGPLGRLAASPESSPNTRKLDDELDLTLERLHEVPNPCGQDSQGDPYKAPQLSQEVLSAVVDDCNSSGDLGPASASPDSVQLVSDAVLVYSQSEGSTALADPMTPSAAEKVDVQEHDGTSTGPGPASVTTNTPAVEHSAAVTPESVTSQSSAIPAVKHAFLLPTSVRWSDLMEEEEAGARLQDSATWEKLQAEILRAPCATETGCSETSKSPSTDVQLPTLVPATVVAPPSHHTSPPSTVQCSTTATYSVIPLRHPIPQRAAVGPIVTTPLPLHPVVPGRPNATGAFRNEPRLASHTTSLNPIAPISLQAPSPQCMDSAASNTRIPAMPSSICTKMPSQATATAQNAHPSGPHMSPSFLRQTPNYTSSIGLSLAPCSSAGPAPLMSAPVFQSNASGCAKIPTARTLCPPTSTIVPSLPWEYKLTYSRTLLKRPTGAPPGAIGGVYDSDVTLNGLPVCPPRAYIFPPGHKANAAVGVCMKDTPTSTSATLLGQNRTALPVASGSALTASSESSLKTTPSSSVPAAAAPAGTRTDQHVSDTSAVNVGEPDDGKGRGKGKQAKKKKMPKPTPEELALQAYQNSVYRSPDADWGRGPIFLERI
ncbi:hypothetical protein C8Q76DRAFT_853039 [Earliella scabrosa]|nr:hypothetical protein C8Q76DRAFT_853039 [Earliella scabrosa]